MKIHQNQNLDEHEIFFDSVDKLVENPNNIAQNTDSSKNYPMHYEVQADVHVPSGENVKDLKTTEALSGSDRLLWKKAMQEEFDLIMEKKTWELTDQIELQLNVNGFLRK